MKTKRMIDLVKDYPVLRIRDLPVNPSTGVFLYCPSCTSILSANRGDYFNVDPMQEMYCGACVDNTPLRLVRKIERYEVIK